MKHIYLQCNIYIISVVDLSDHSDTVPEKNHRSTDSDNEEFCDSMEHLAMDEVWSKVLQSVRDNTLTVTAHL